MSKYSFRLNFIIVYFIYSMENIKNTKKWFTRMLTRPPKNKVIPINNSNPTQTIPRIERHLHLSKTKGQPRFLFTNY